ncbi:hypothetical protein ABZ890_08310 [Streptomyces sp. NPDC046984]|uniref:hypothetical protein n=1 Tax=Streptomyces sp. NPDC046984 TaxID=3155138 RepID=UPI0033CC9F7B
MSGVRDAIDAEITQLRVSGIAPGLAQVALSLADLLDGQEGSTAKSNAARELRAVMEDLRKLAPVAEETDRVDELAQRRGGGRFRARRA